MFEFDTFWSGGALNPSSSSGQFVVDGEDCAPVAVCTGAFAPQNPLATLLGFTIVPRVDEPTTLALMGLALLGAPWLRRRVGRALRA